MLEIKDPTFFKQFAAIASSFKYHLASASSADSYQSMVNIQIWFGLAAFFPFLVEGPAVFLFCITKFMCWCFSVQFLFNVFYCRYLPIIFLVFNYVIVYNLSFEKLVFCLWCSLWVCIWMNSYTKKRFDHIVKCVILCSKIPLHHSILISY